MMRLRGLGHAYGDLAVIDRLDLAVAPGEFVVVLGPSGCGKSTLLSLLGGHLAPARGTVERDGGVWTIQQDGSLFPWLTVRENVGRAALPGFDDRYPHELSGGMRQRVELARALESGAGTLLFDEPFSALDWQTRRRLRRELVDTLQDVPRTVIFVTHDVDEAVQLADRVVVLSSRPARIVREVRIDVPHPRDPEELSGLARQLAECLP